MAGKAPSGDLSEIGGTQPRHAARVLIVNERGDVLLLRGHDPMNPERSWWFTVGGGLDAGETHRQAAVREAFEETGIALAEDALVGPVWERTAVFDFLGGNITQCEQFFVARVTSGDVRLTRDGWSEVERDSVDEMAWMSHRDLLDAPIEVFPMRLPAELPRALAWDGLTIDLGVGE